jgi:hypothetical protein
MNWRFCPSWEGVSINFLNNNLCIFHLFNFGVSVHLRRGFFSLLRIISPFITLSTN